MHRWYRILIIKYIKLIRYLYKHLELCVPNPIQIIKYHSLTYYYLYIYGHCNYLCLIL